MSIGMTMQQQRKLCCTDTDSFLGHAKSEHVHAELVEYVETRFDTSNYEVGKLYP